MSSANDAAGAQSLAAWAAYHGLTVTTRELPAIRTDSLVHRYSQREILARRVGSPVLNALPGFIYRPVTTALKQLRSRQPHTDVSLDFHPDDLERAWEGIRQANRSLAKATVCLTHDIDTADCYRMWMRVAEIEQKLGCRSAWNVLTEGPYRLERDRLDEMVREGFEIALHGDSHDMALGYRDMEAVRVRLLRCLDMLGHQVRGFRAPALGYSEPLLRILSELRFEYDSSIKARYVYSSGVSHTLPYLHPHGNGIWELPLTVADDLLFREWHLADNGALRVIDIIVDDIKRRCSMLVINTHPINLIGRFAFYERMLRRLVEDADVQVVLPCTVVQNLRSYAKSAMPALTSLAEPDVNS